MKKWDKQKRNIAVTAAVTTCICFLTFYSVFASRQSKPTVTIAGAPASNRSDLEASQQSHGESASSDAACVPESAIPSSESAVSEISVASRPKVSSKAPADSFSQKPEENSSQAVSSSPPASSSQPADSSVAEPVKININTATEKELLQIPNLLKVKAGLIIHYREEHGPFETVEDLMNVRGIGPELFEMIRPYICV